MSIINIVLISTLIANIVGVLLHFTHKFFKRDILIHFFSAVNESTWEHMKLLFSPILLISFVQYFLFKNSIPNILESNLVGLITGLISLPLIYYPIKYILKKEIVWISILIFIISVCIAYVVEYIFLTKQISYIGELGSLFGLITIFLLFAIFTFKPPKLFLFKDPVDGRYGDKS